MSLSGTWYNELGSEMHVEQDGSSVSGTYRTGVGHAPGEYALVGLTDAKPLPRSQALAFVVVWSNGSRGASATSWSGQYQTIDGEETITATWLLTLETVPNADWSSTIVGVDVFTRRRPPEETIARRARQSTWSHPAVA